jgi:ABC-type ATPase involved in cell division
VPLKVYLTDLVTEMEDKSTIKSLYLIGPSSTGKSTLFRAIMEDMRLDPEQCVTEVARMVMKNTDFSKKTIGYVNPVLMSDRKPVYDTEQGYRDAVDNFEGAV